MNEVMRVFKRVDRLVATIVASAFALIAPDEGYTGVHTQAKTVC